MLRSAAVQLVKAQLALPVGAWTYYEWRPPELAEAVEVIWQSDGTAWEPQDRHYPQPAVELLVNVSGDRFRLLEPAGSEFFDEAWLAGMQVGPVVTEVPRHAVVLGMRLRPAGAFAVLQRPMGELSGVVADLRDLVGRAARELTDRCRDATSVAARFRIAAAWIVERMAGSADVLPAIGWSARQIEQSGGAVSIADLRAETGLSKTKMVAAFRDQIGVSPKLYARIVRFSRAMAILQAGRAALADVALAAGYYDQPHMNAEFRELSGLPPTAHLAARPSADGVPTAPPPTD